MIRFIFEDESPISFQIYNQIKTMVLSGILTPEERLPSSRVLAKEHRISRNTVVSAYDMLISEGYIFSNSTCGTYIANQSFLAELLPCTQRASSVMIEEDKQTAPFRNIISFETGVPALDLVPRQKLGNITKHIFSQANGELFGYDYPEGRPELRIAICKFLNKTRNINCSPHQIIITSGTKQSMTLIAKCLLDVNSNIVIEDPSFEKIRKIFGLANNYYPVPTDTDGMITSLLPDDIKPDIVFTTPSHQIPMGGILSIQRRLDILKYAQDKNCLIIEDDYDSEFNYENKFVPTLKELDSNNQFILYAGTFSKVLYPSLRIGYLLVPDRLLERFKEVKSLGDQFTNTINQLVLAQYIEEGHLAKHILKMKKLYKRKRDFLIKALIDTFGESVEILGFSSGMHIIAKFKNIVFTDDLVKKIYENGVVLSPFVEKVAQMKGQHIGEISLGYTNLSEEQIARGVEIIKTVLFK